MDSDIFKTIIAFVSMPIVGIMSYFIKKHIDKLEDLDKRTTSAEKSILVIQSQMSDIRQDIDEIKVGIQKLVDKLCQP